MFLFAFGTIQDFRKGIYSWVDGIIWDFLMSVANFEMVLPEMRIKKTFGIMLSLAGKTKFERNYMIT